MLETERMRAAALCPCGHGFTLELLVSINTDTDPDLFFSLGQDGSQLIVCPTCALSWSPVEPVLIHTPSKGQLFLMIPDALSHRTLELKAAALLSLKSAPPERITPEIIQFPTLSRRAIETFLSSSDAESAQPPKAEVPVGIARAFADLSSIVPGPIRK